MLCCRGGGGGRILTKNNKLTQTDKASQEAIKLHSYYRGKIQTAPRCVVRSIDDFAIWYTPGVAAPCQAIERIRI